MLLMYYNETLNGINITNIFFNTDYCCKVIKMIKYSLNWVHKHIFI
jgi:hypothetical protein